MSRNLERSMARALYAKFAKKWRQEQRLSDTYGQRRKPRFGEWYEVYRQSLNAPPVREQTAELSPDGPVLTDPWEEPERAVTSERGVTTIDILGREDD